MNARDNPDKYWKKSIFFKELIISSLGEVWSNKSDCFLVSEIRHNGFSGISVDCGNKHPTELFVHIEVARAFVPNPDNKENVWYMDFNQQNCRADNLIWLTRKELLAEKRKCQEAVVAKKREDILIARRVNSANRKYMRLGGYVDKS